MKKSGIALVCVIGMMALVWTATASATEPQRVVTADVLDRSFAVNWATSVSEVGRVWYGTDPGDLSLSAEDVRSSPENQGYCHRVRITGLDPQDTIYFKIESGGTLYDDGGSPYQVTTGASQNPFPDTKMGLVKNYTTGDPMGDVLVYMTLEDNDSQGTSGRSLPLSAVTPSSGALPGAYSIDISTARQEGDVDQLFDYTESGGDNILVQVDACQCPPDPEVTVDTSVTILDDLFACQGCATGYLCATVYLHGFWNGSQHTCATTVDIDLYSDPEELADYSFTGVSLAADGAVEVDLATEGVATGSYYVVVRHYNHLDLISFLAHAWDGSTPVQIDFSIAANVSHGTGALKYDKSTWCMPGGDATGDNRVNLADYGRLLSNWNGTNQGADFNCDGFCRLSDYPILLGTWNMQSYAP